jgi:DNA-directed RNA polymerase subunit M/transcription elongation factor TFIIS
MKFCETCGNVLLPKRKKNLLYCKVCDKEVPIEDPKNALTDYKRRPPNKKSLDKKKALKTAILTDAEKSNLISEEDREAYEDLFMVGEDFGGEE